jgi:hypothetical protein
MSTTVWLQVRKRAYSRILASCSHPAATRINTHRSQSRPSSLDRSRRRAGQSLASQRTLSLSCLACYALNFTKTEQTTHHLACRRPRNTKEKSVRTAGLRWQKKQHLSPWRVVTMIKISTRKRRMDRHPAPSSITLIMTIQHASSQSYSCPQNRKISQRMDRD